LSPLQDVNKEPGAEDLFKKIGEAYEVRPCSTSRQPVIAILGHGRATSCALQLMGAWRKPFAQRAGA
jgi:hypothetical protein